MPAAIRLERVTLRYRIPRERIGSLALGALVLVTGWVFFCHRRDDMAYWS